MRPKVTALRAGLTRSCQGLLIAGLLTTSIACGDPSDSAEPEAQEGGVSVAATGPNSAASFVYEVQWPEATSSGKVLVRSTAESGGTVEQLVTLPWVSDSISVRVGEEYLLEAAAEDDGGRVLNCWISTSNGWNIGAAIATDPCTVRFPREDS